MNVPAPEFRNRVADELLAYLESHPSAADTLDGILNWWLPRQRYETEQQRIETVLEELVRDGRITKKELPDGTIVYGRGARTRLAGART